MQGIISNQVKNFLWYFSEYEIKRDISEDRTFYTCPNKLQNIIFYNNYVPPKRHRGTLVYF